MVQLPYKSYGFQSRTNYVGRSSFPTKSLRQDYKYRKKITRLQVQDLTPPLLIPDKIVPDKPNIFKFIYTLLTDHHERVKPGPCKADYCVEICDLESINRQFPDASKELVSKMEKLVTNGCKTVIDPSKFPSTLGDPLPAPPSKMNPLLQPFVPKPISVPELDESVLKVLNKDTEQLLSIIEKLPFVVFCYIFIEFFFLRKNVDLYKEDIEDDAAGVFAESVSDLTVRMGIFFVLTIVTIIVN